MLGPQQQTNKDAKSLLFQLKKLTNQLTKPGFTTIFRKVTEIH
ncbi:hypothetical protein SynROS8604_00574 [Synechococcus sp. ROS8604]|nr:hypothetical protein SynROS8604_00570 [Synechococcus sp. ROS8604]QNI87239.1 hypothetical protein SynROS8604_00574 [Synechococcus sp. ROS8604]